MLATPLIPVAPINTVALFPKLSVALLAVLRPLSADEWNLPTVCAGWTVKDVAAHLLDTELRRLSAQRDGWRPPASARSFETFEALVNHLNTLNEQWVHAYRRVSPVWLVNLLAQADQQLSAYLETLDLTAPAQVAVAWAGETQSAVWFDVAREYTERWLHQQHIREAVGQPLLLGSPFVFPLLDTFMRALPHALRHTPAANGTAVNVIIGEHAWTARREDQTWRLYSGADAQATAKLYMPADTAWRLFSKGLPVAEARAKIQAHGDAGLIEPVLHMVALMA